LIALNKSNIAKLALYSNGVCKSMKQLTGETWDQREQSGDFGERFIELARSVYRHNDLRWGEC